MQIICPKCVTSFQVADEALGALVTCTKCGATFPPASAQTYVLPPTPVQISGTQSPANAPRWEGPPAGTKLGGYTLDAPLGSGGMGMVYRAVQTSLSRPVALKVLPPQLATDPQFVERFQREALTLGALSHPHIVSVIDRGVESGMAYLAMELVEGESLRHRMARGGLSNAEMTRLAIQVCEGLAYAHSKGIVHRDIKPENLLLDRSGSVKIADFGLARIVRGDAQQPTRLTLSNMTLGTPFYMAPEQMEGAGSVDARADLYSLGVVLYEALTGGLPMGRFESPREKFRDVDPRLDGLVMQLLEKSPDRRPSSATEVSAVLQGILDRPVPAGIAADAPTRLRPVVPAAPFAPPRPKRTAIGLAGALGCVVAVVVGLFMFLVARSTDERRQSAQSAVSAHAALPPQLVEDWDDSEWERAEPSMQMSIDQAAQQAAARVLNAYVKQNGGSYPAKVEELWKWNQGGMPRLLRWYDVEIDPKTHGATVHRPRGTLPTKEK